MKAIAGMIKGQLKVDEGFWDKVLRIAYGVKRNTTLEKAILYTAELLNSAEETIWIVAGTLGSDLWANPKIIEALEQAADDPERKVEIRIICGPELDPANTEIPRLHQEGKLYLYKLPNRPGNQFIVVDEKHARVEEFHITGEPRRAWVRHNTLMLGRRLSLDFKALLPRTVQVSRNEQQ